MTAATDEPSEQDIPGHVTQTLKDLITIYCPEYSNTYFEATTTITHDGQSRIAELPMYDPVRDLTIQNQGIVILTIRALPPGLFHLRLENAGETTTRPASDQATIEEALHERWPAVTGTPCQFTMTGG